MSEKLKYGIKILVLGQVDLELWIKTISCMHILINNPRTTGPAKILMPFLSFSDNLHLENHINFSQKELIVLR